jgi:putative lumazine-binding protein
VTVSDEAAIQETVLDYFEGWFDGDPDRMERALHPQLAKRSLQDGSIEHITAPEMVEWTAAGRGKSRDPRERRIEVKVIEVYGDIATAVVDSNVYREYLHLTRTGDGWRIVNALWDWA